VDGGGLGGAVFGGALEQELISRAATMREEAVTVARFARALVISPPSLD
jgi:hypothetical protein